VKKVSDAGGCSGSVEVSELNAKIKSLANLVTQLSSGHKILKEKVAKSKSSPAPAPAAAQLSDAEKEKEKKRKYDYWAKNKTEQAAAVAAENAAEAADDG
jgi:hypothetical protein